MRSPRITHDCPSTSLVSYWIGRGLLTLLGWKVEGEVPTGTNFVVIAAPHTSNWDFPIGLAAAYLLRLRVNWIGKHTLFRWPYGGFMRWLGGIGVDRSNPAGIAEQMAQQLKNADRMVLAITPDGTRGRREYWKSGFYRIALAAKVPIFCGALDYRTKTVRIGLSFLPSGDISADMAQIRAFYADVSGANPDNHTPIRLSEELESDPTGQIQAS
ncbi:lysophospholipid acyltransferase family protein [Sedimenticola sp.]|uniref:lysophospholipid acyltransferase family protein n=1 Tax=Sedimenticola sp. TaxID=1940285 RepID=UPI003D14CEA4